MLDLVIACIIERTDLDTHGAAMIVAEVRKTARVDDVGDSPVVLANGLGQNGLCWALTDANTARGTEILDPRMIIVGAQG